ncbi:MAG: T9SS type A sorting domain-containing protein [Chitinophagaceae bacterium]|nr:T9SS type A sorting domain-containing protein [Chitinophagaceae bacterium]
MKRNLPILPFYMKGIIFFIFLLFHDTDGNAQTVVVDYGKSYVNITKGLTGGTVEVGDTLEMRSTFVVRCTSGCPAFVDSCAYYDTVKAGTAYIPSSLAVRTNEGKIYKSFTDVSGDDCGNITGNNIRINLGFNNADAPATAFRRGRVRNTHKPSLFGSTCVIVASYRLRVTSALGTIINTGGGRITYQPTTSGTPLSLNYPYNNTIISTNYGICTNTVGTNALGTEFNGTFGSGRPRNRTASGSVPGTYTYNMFTTNGPGDYFYGIPNNTSTQTNYTTSNAWAKPDPTSPTHRVFQVWDIIGDHTGAVSPLLGNPAADTVANANAGYMLVVNASYRIDSAFSHTISGLCPNTYYELSAWFRNVCSKCGCDSNGKGASNSSGPPFYIPTATNDSSGVYPNLTLRVNGIDYYTTGNLRYTGLWVKKGFTYVTGPLQTSLTMTIRNNAPGGGGNDWAIDDISLATCTPTLNLVPSGGTNVCYGNQVDMYTTVRCFSPNYIHWTWERSTNGGATWTPTGVSGIGSPAMVAGEWQYTASYPSFLGDSAHHNNMFRIRVASTAGNLLNPTCSYTASNTILVWVNNCSELLKTDLVDFTGQLSDNHAQLAWTSTNEQSGVVFDVQRSENKTDFITIGSVNGIALTGFGNTYRFTDNQAINAQTFYRIKVREGEAQKNSKIVTLSSKQEEFTIRSLINPFGTQLSFELLSPTGGKVNISLIDSYGRVLKQSTETIQGGLNNLTLSGLDQLASSGYILRVQMGNMILNKQVLKQMP